MPNTVSANKKHLRSTSPFRLELTWSRFYEPVSMSECLFVCIFDNPNSVCVRITIGLLEFEYESDKQFNQS